MEEETRKDLDRLLLPSSLLPVFSPVVLRPRLIMIITLFLLLFSFFLPSLLINFFPQVFNFSLKNFFSILFQDFSSSN